jgi:hypothetical protein
MSWTDLEAELSRWRETGRAADFWWRDDDAGRLTPQLEGLLALQGKTAVPLALAVIPAHAEDAMLAALGPGVSVLQHGTDHVNRAAANEKKTEFPAAAGPTEALARIDAGRKALEEKAGKRFVAVLAPPWNRFREDLIPRLPGIAVAGLTRFGPRRNPMPAPRVKQVNTHVDIIAWQGNRQFVGEDAALQAAVRHLEGRRKRTLDAAEPTGLLTHHACHDAAAWRFLECLFETTRAAGARWRASVELFT